MSEWWDSLLGIQKLFYLFAIPGSVLLILQTFGALFGLFDNDIDMEGGSDLSADGDAADIRFFSLRSIVAFITMFGWTGVVMLSVNEEANILFVLLVSLAVGFLVAIVIAYMVHGLSKVQSSGNISNKNAVNVVGKVYLEIPPERSGTGKVHIMIQGRYREVDVITDGEKIERGRQIIVTEALDDNTLLVKPL